MCSCGHVQRRYAYAVVRVASRPGRGIAQRRRWRAQRACATHKLSRVRFPLSYHGLCCPTKTRSGGDRARSAYCSLISSSRRPVALAPSHAPRAPHPAVCAMLCDRTQQFAPQHLCSWLCANPGPHHCSTTRTPRAHRALLRCRCMICPSALSSQPSCSPPLHSAPCAAPTGTTSPAMWLLDCGVLRTHLQF